MTLSMREVIDPDALQASEQVALRDLLGGDAFADRADRAPRDAHQLRHRLVGGVDRQPAALVLERDGEPRVMPRPRDRGHDHPMVLAVHPRRVGLQIRKRRPEVQRPPAPASLPAILPWAAPPAHAATMHLPRPGADRDHDRLQLDANVLDHRPLYPEQHLPYASLAHAATALSRRFLPSEAETVRAPAACALLPAPWALRARRHRHTARADGAVKQRKPLHGTTTTRAPRQPSLLDDDGPPRYPRSPLNQPPETAQAPKINGQRRIASRLLSYMHVLCTRSETFRSRRTIPRSEPSHSMKRSSSCTRAARSN
jgi:hypothetical protein